MTKRKIDTVDRAYEKLFKKYIVELLEHKKNDYTGESEPFEIQAEKVKKDVSDYFHHFHDCFMNGYEVLIKQLKKK